MTALVERLTMGSAAGSSASRRASSLPVSGVSATGINPPLSRVSSDVEPWGDPDVLDGEEQAQQQLDGEEPQHRDGEELERHVLEDARALQKLLLELAGAREPVLEPREGLQVGPLHPAAQHQPVEEEPARDEDGPDDDGAEQLLEGRRVEERQPPPGDYLVEVAVAVEDHRVVIPRL